MPLVQWQWQQMKLGAEREIIADDRIRVTFVETVFKVFGREVKRSPTNGKGVWTQQHVEAGQAR